MKKDIDCRVFEDQLDSLVSGSLPEDGIDQLKLHASSCHACMMLFRVKEHLLTPSLGDLEESVPEEMVASMWQRVEAEVRPRSEADLALTPGHASEPSSDPVYDRAPTPMRRSWLLPTLAAASVALLFSTGFLLTRLRTVEAGAIALQTQIGDLQRDMVELDARTEWVERTGQLAGSRRTQTRALGYLLTGQESVTVADLVRLLGMYPANRVVFTASEVNDLTGTSARIPPELRELVSILAAALTDQDGVGEVRAGELAEWLASSDLDQTLSVPKGPLIEILS